MYYNNLEPQKCNSTKKFLEEFKKDFSRYKEINIWGIKKGMYLISPVGDVYSTHKKDWLNGEITGVTGNYKGVKTVWLRMEDPEIGAKRFYVARLTMAMFNGMPPEDMKDPTVDHIDCDSLNNYYKNLRWVERDVNASLRFSRGIGEENGRAKLTQNDVIEICNTLVKKKATVAEMAKKYCVSEWAVWNIVNHKTWKHISCLFNFEGVR